MCAGELGLKEFEGCEATVKFLRMFDSAFDILNSRNRFSKGPKAALFSWTDMSKIKNIQDYIRSIKDSHQKSIFSTLKLTGFLGFIMGLEICSLMVEDLILKEKILDFVLTYKLSQVKYIQNSNYIGTVEFEFVH